MQNKIFTSKELRFRITQLEYENLSSEEHKKEIQRIYFEETGEALPAEIEIFKTSQSDKIADESEYVGSAIRFHSEANGIDEVYVVSQGTQGLDDWLYNLEAMVAG